MKNYRHEKAVDTFTTAKMLEFYAELDVLKFKYDFPVDINLVEEDRQIDWLSYNKIAEYEEAYQLSGLTKIDYANDAANYDFVYDQVEAREDHIRLLQMIRDKIITQYIGIDGIERLFSESYIEFEWEMHLSVDYKKHGLKFYRDHYFHQIRDAFMMHVLLQDYGFYENVKNILIDKSESKVSNYVHKMLLQQTFEQVGYADQLISSNDKEFYIRNLIYMASYMAALFHDIGYPEGYYITMSRRIKEYLPIVSCLNGMDYDLGAVRSSLENTLLFRLVPYDEIEERLTNKKKPDHGVLSAIIFLMHFYGNGAIYGLEPYKKAAVELAALAIYNHTNKYGIQGKDKKDAYRPCFHLNPLSYLLRICDDMQEWERIYFFLANGSNLLLCDKCHFPIKKIMKKGKSERDNRVCYTCACTQEKGVDNSLFERFFDGEYQFHYRRIYNIQVCDSADIKAYKKSREELGSENSENGKIETLVVRLNYNPHKLMHAAYLNPDYARHRINELNGLKKLLLTQSGMPRIYLDYVVTSNPILIKTLIFETLIKEYDILAHAGEGDLLDRDYQHVFSDADMEKYRTCVSEMINRAVADGKEDNKPDQLPRPIGDSSLIDEKEFLRQYLQDITDIYFRLCVCKKIYEIRFEQNFTQDKLNRFMEKHENEICGMELTDQCDVKCLIRDCFTQFKRMYKNFNSLEDYPDEYMYQFLPKTADYYGAQKRFIDMDRYEPLFVKRINRGIRCMDAYTDLYFFRLLQ